MQILKWPRDSQVNRHNGLATDGRNGPWKPACVNINTVGEDSTVGETFTITAINVILPVIFHRDKDRKDQRGKNESVYYC